MLKLTIFAVIIANALSVSVPTLSGLLPDLDGRIVNGEETNIEYHPYQVSLQKTGSHICGGSLIEPDVILTAAHCLQGSTVASQLKIRAGSTSRKDGGVLIDVANFIAHPGYNKTERMNDVALVRLALPVNITNTVRTIELASVTPRTGTRAIVTGWGVTRQFALISPTNLMRVEVQMVTQQDCASDIYNYGEGIRDTMVCTYAERKDACQGDSGGPLVAEHRLVGVVSWGYGCAQPNYPGVYADVAQMRSWIVETAKIV